MTFMCLMVSDCKNISRNNFKIRWDQRSVIMLCCCYIMLLYFVIMLLWLLCYYGYYGLLFFLFSVQGNKEEKPKSPSQPTRYFKLIYEPQEKKGFKDLLHSFFVLFKFLWLSLVTLLWRRKWDSWHIELGSLLFKTSSDKKFIFFYIFNT